MMSDGEKAFRRSERKRVIRSALLLYSLALIFLLLGLSPQIAEWWFEVPVFSALSVKHYQFAVPFLSLLIAGFLVERQFKAYDYLSGRNARWLRTTPWRPGMRLPLARRSLELSDVLLLAPIIALCAWISPAQVWMPGAALAVVFLIRLMLVNIAAKQNTALVIALFVAAGCTLSISLPARVCVALAAVLVLILGALKAKPAFNLIEPEPSVDRFGGLPGWIRRQMPAVQHEPHPRGVGLVIGLAVFWPAFCFLQLDMFDAKDERTALAVSFAISLVIAVARWADYVGRHHAPISLRGRFQMRHWLVPSHDRVLIAPLASTVVVLIILALCLNLRVPFSISIALLPAIALMICIESGPTRRNWTLTGQHHVPRTTMKEISFDSTTGSRRK
jgi:hypothetical protein